MKKKEQAKKLWDLCFNDDPAFTDLYFKKRYTDNNTIALSEQGAIVSVMQLLSYPLTYRQHVLPSSYVSGACTDPKMRGKGLMSKLLKKALGRLYKQGIPICTLIPAHDWLFDYYGNSGFSTLFYNSFTTGDVNNIKISNKDFLVAIEDEYSPNSYEYLEKKLLQKECSILHTKDDYEVILEDLKLAGGKVITAYYLGNIVGITIAYLNSEASTVYINELQYDNESIKEFLIYKSCDYFNTDKFHITHHANLDQGDPFGMLRVVRALDMINLYASENPHIKQEFYLKDSIIKENTGYYNVSNGSVKFISCNTNDKKIREISINELATLLFNKLHPYMSLMLD